MGLCNYLGFVQRSVYLSLPLKIIVFIFGSLVEENLGGGRDLPIVRGQLELLSVVFPWISPTPEGVG